MRGKFWPDHLGYGSIEVAGTCWFLAHLRPHSCTVVVPGSAGSPAVTLTLDIEYSSHCISKGPKKGQSIDFGSIGHDHLVIDHRQIQRAFNVERYHLSHLLPKIIQSLHQRHCLFTGHQNFLTLELGEFPGYPPGAKYEVFFSVRKGDARNTLRVIVESAYVRDEDADNAPVSFKKDDRIRGEKLLLKKARGEPIRQPPAQGRGRR
nr:hypothetical protein [Azotobacter beijerinckii]